jgi:hypothetical protein
MEDTVSCCWSVGHCCDSHPEFAPLNEWNSGFAIVAIGSDGSYQVDNYLVQDGKVYSI